MAADFDPDDKNMWYFGPLSRDDTNEILGTEREGGVFLVRDSLSIRGDFVLCVREDAKVSHYIINKINVNGIVRFKIGDQDFLDLPSLLRFYKTHYLDTTSLIRPAQREKRLAKFDFAGRDPEDLPFKKNEILVVLQKDEEMWWTAMNSQGHTGQIPVTYTEKYTPEVQRQMAQNFAAPVYVQPNVGVANIQNGQVHLPAKARVLRTYVPSPYIKDALHLEAGDIVEVTKMNTNGQWEGICNNKNGHFPFTHVRFLDGDEPEGDDE